MGTVMVVDAPGESKWNNGIVVYGTTPVEFVAVEMDRELEPLIHLPFDEFVARQVDAISRYLFIPL